MKIKTRTAKSDGGRHPVWDLGYLDAAAKDARRFLAEAQYAHIVQQFDDLAGESDPAQSDTVDVRPIDDFFELRDKGGLLGRLMFVCISRTAKKRS